MCVAPAKKKIEICRKPRNTARRSSTSSPYNIEFSPSLPKLRTNEDVAAVFRKYLDKAKPVEGTIKLLNDKKDVMYCFKGEVGNNSVCITTLLQAELDFYKCVKGVLKYFSTPGKKLMLNMRAHYKDSGKTTMILDDEENKKKEVFRSIFNFISSKFYNCAIHPSIDYEELTERFVVTFLSNWNIIVSPRISSIIASKSIFISSKPGCIKEMDLKVSKFTIKSTTNTSAKNSLKKHMLEETLSKNQVSHSKYSQAILNAQIYGVNCIKIFIGKSRELAQYLIKDEETDKIYDQHIINLAIAFYSKTIDLLNGKENILHNPLFFKAAELLGFKFEMDANITDDVKKAIRTQITNLLRNVINYYNKMVPHLSTQSSFKYYIGEGNNSNLILSIMRQRWWWSKAKKSQKEACNLIWTQWKKNSYYQYLMGSESPKFYNHIEGNHHISNKKNLYLNMHHYYSAKGQPPFLVLPETYLIKDFTSDEYASLRASYKQHANNKEYVWIIKPGENTNRGKSISLAGTLDEINKSIEDLITDRHSAIVQKYIEKPLLIMGRKFDIRCYGLITSINNFLKGYCYKEGYIRTSSKEFDLSNLDSKFIHLTNDAIQKHGNDYGKFESGNKLSYNEFSKYLLSQEEYKNVNFKTQILKKIKSIISDTFKAVGKRIDPEKMCHTFEIFGYDFMIDTELNVYLIEVNTNPCYELSCSLLSQIIPEMIDSALKLVIDPVFGHADMCVQKANYQQLMCKNRFQLVYDDTMEGI